MKPFTKQSGHTFVYVLIAMVFAGGLFWLFGIDNAARSSKDAKLALESTCQVKRESFDLIVISSGELEAATRVELKCKVEGRSTIAEVIPEGNRVKEGDILIRLADDEIKKQLESAQLSFEQSEVDVQTGKEGLVIEKNEADSKFKAAELKLELARLDLEKWQKGDDPQKQRTLELAKEKATRSLKRAKENLVLSRQLYEEQFISKSEVEDDELALLETKSDLVTTTLNIEVYRKFTRPKEFKKVESAVQQAVAELDRTHRRNKSLLVQAETKLRGAKQRLKIHQTRLDKVKKQLEATIIKAPQDGLVVYATSVGSRRRSRADPIAQGRQVRFNEKLIYLPDTSMMNAVVKVHESVISQVKKDQKVTVTIDALPRKLLVGKVGEIGIMAMSGGWMNPDLREYMVKIALPKDQQTTLKPAMRCTVKIVTGHVDNALVVPFQAIFSQGQQRYCYIYNAAGKVIRKQVKIGRSNESFVEIKSGLTEADYVLLRQPKPNELDSKSKPATSDSLKSDSK